MWVLSLSDLAPVAFGENFQLWMNKWFGQRPFRGARPAVCREFDLQQICISQLWQQVRMDEWVSVCMLNGHSHRWWWTVKNNSWSSHSKQFLLFAFFLSSVEETQIHLRQLKKHRNHKPTDKSDLEFRWWNFFILLSCLCLKNSNFRLTRMNKFCFRNENSMQISSTKFKSSRCAFVNNFEVTFDGRMGNVYKLRNFNCFLGKFLIEVFSFKFYQSFLQIFNQFSEFFLKFHNIFPINYFPELWELLKVLN